MNDSKALAMRGLFQIALGFCAGVSVACAFFVYLTLN